MNEQLEIILTKYIAGEADEAEKLRAEEWINASSENETLYLEMYDAWHVAQAASVYELVDVDKAYQHFAARQFKARHISIRAAFFKKLAVAAVFAAVIVFAGLWLTERNRNQQLPVTALEEISVPLNAKKKIVLPDSTLIWINESSTLKWDNGFNKTNRTVYLEGEAYFEVTAHKSALAFIVKTSQYTIRDIGTIFNVKSHTADSSFEAMVIEGVVSVKGNFPSANNVTEVRLLKNDVLKIRNVKPLATTAKPGKQADSEKPEVEIVKALKPELYVGWKDDMLVFDDESFPAVIRKLERKYGVIIAFDSSKLAGYHYSGSFNAGTSIDNVLDVLAETTPVQYEKEEGRIIIKTKSK